MKREKPHLAWSLSDGSDEGGQLQKLAAASANIIAASTAEATLQEIADQARRTIGAHLAATHTIARQAWPSAGVAVSLSEKYERYSRFSAAPTGAGIYAEVVRSQRPIRLTASELVQDSAWRGFSEYRREHPPLNGLIAVPLSGRSGVAIGVVMVSDKEHGEFSPDDEAILVQLAQVASVSIENALALDAVRASEERLRATHENANVAIGECDSSGRFVAVNNGFCKLTGYSRDELLGLTLFDITHPEDGAGERSTFERHAAGGLDTYEWEKRYIRKGGEIIWVHVAASAVFDPERRYSYGVRVVRDITERKRADERQHLLIRELHHRVKNTLATVQAIAGSTIRSVESMEDFRTAFTDRLVSLGKTHSLLTEHGWRGASLRELLRSELDPYDDGRGNRIKLTGPDVSLEPEMVLALGMAFHELTTNAVKYGALSVLGGCVEVEWAVRGQGTPLLMIVWRESNGPPVAKPKREGFGTQLLRRVLGAQVHGNVDVTFARKGVCVAIEAGLAA